MKIKFVCRVNLGFAFGYLDYCLAVNICLFIHPILHGFLSTALVQLETVPAL